MNYIHVAGHLGADPETRFTTGGKKITVLRVAANNRRSKKEETIWWRVYLWGEDYNNIIPYLKKGSPIIVVGEMNKPEIFTDKEGRPQISLNINAKDIMFSPFGKPEKTEGSEKLQKKPEAESAAAMAVGSQPGKINEEEFMEDDIPF